MGKYPNILLRVFVVSILVISGIEFTQGSKKAFAYDSTDFVIKVKTDNPGTSSDTEFTIPTNWIAGSYSYNVDCDDDGTDDLTGQTGSSTCSYNSAGEYYISISGNFPAIYFNNSGDRLKLLEIVQWGNQQWSYMQRAFMGAANMTLTATDNPDLSNVVDMGSMFQGATSFNSNINSWDVSNIQYMQNLFNGASAFNQPLNSWDVSNVVSMQQMFLDAASFNQDISTWNVANVTNMYYMFYGASAFNQPLNGWDVSSVTNMNSMFSSATAFNQPLNLWDVSNVTVMTGMFRYATAFNQPLNAWNVSSVTTFDQMFWFASSYNQAMNLWITTGATDFSWMFFGASAFNQDVSSWNVSNATDMEGMFGGATAFNQPLNSWSVSNVVNMDGMFSGATAFNQPLDSWNTQNVTDMRSMFAGAVAFDQSLATWDVSGVIDFVGFLFSAEISRSNYESTLIAWSGLDLVDNLEFDAGNSKYCSQNAQAARQNIVQNNSWTISDGGINCYSASDFVMVVDTGTTSIETTTDTEFLIPTTGSGYDFNVDCDADGTLDWTSQTGNVLCSYSSPGIYTVVISGLFPRIYFNSENDSIKLLEVKQWGSQNWSSMSRSFAGTTNMTLTAYDVPNLAGVLDMNGMFYGASSMNQSINNWDVSNVTNMSSMFQYASSFDQPLDSWNVSNVQTMADMFHGAAAFNQDISAWDVSGVNDFSFMFRFSAFNSQIGSWDVSNVTNMSYMFSSSPFNQDISSWNVGSVVDMSSMFYSNNAFNQPLSTWDVSDVVDMSNMFEWNSAFNQDISFWNTSSLMDASWMFYQATSFDQNLGGWNVSNLVDATGMFDSVTLSTSNYDSLLLGWSARTLNNDVPFSGGNSQYCSSETARQNIIDSFSWTISDGGLNCPIVLDSDVSLSADIVNTGAIRVGDSVWYELAISNFGPDSYEQNDLELMMIIPENSQFEGVGIAEDNEYSIDCSDMGPASGIMPAFSVHNGNFISCAIDISDTVFTVSDTIEISLELLANSNFESGVDTIYAAVFLDAANDPDAGEIDAAAEANNSPYLLSNNNNIASVTYIYSEPTPSTTTTAPVTTTPSTPTNSNTPSAPTTTSKKSNPLVPVTTAVKPEVSGKVSVALPKQPDFDKFSDVINGNNKSGNNDSSSRGENGKKGPFLVFGSFSVTGSNILDLLIMAVLIFGMGVFLYRRRKEAKSIG